MAPMVLTSPAFAHDQPLPQRFTAEGANDSPPLTWGGVPAQAKELVLVCDDPDAETGVVTHWVAYGLSPKLDGLPEALPDDTLVDEPVELVQGLNEYDQAGYRGPELDDERGRHRVFFRLYALDSELDLPPGVTRRELRQRMKPHVLASTELVGII